MAMFSGLVQGLLSRFCDLAQQGQRGTGVAELAMVSVLAASGVFATTVITSGDALMEQLDKVVHSSMNKVGGAMEVRGSVVVTASGAPLQPETIQFSLGTFGQLPPIGTRPEEGGLLISYLDNTAVAQNVPYIVRFSPGNNGDALLDGGELMTVTVRVADIEAIAGKDVLLPGKRWTLELNVPDGAALAFTRTQPSIYTAVMGLP
jgi:hypothetical protein